MKEKKKGKNSFPIEQLMDILGEAYTGWDAPVISFMAAKGAGPFPILVSTLLSLRTKDEVTEPAAKRLLEKASTPEAMVQLGEEQIRELIFPVGFYPTKAKRLVEISLILLEKYQGAVPSIMEELLALPGVGRKTANLVLVEGFGIPTICVDTHVHRISNRLGYVKTKTPDKTEMALREKLPLPYWISYNEILVAFGQILCRPVSPWCSKCPVAALCRKVGVEKHR
ncbi:endonuclease III [Desulfococcaceae bacterium OttesenSCG-928-F15]|nr:endonuclease III [Desulfococcaceae bacterium OttesenSCG-928-F15]